MTNDKSYLAPALDEVGDDVDEKKDVSEWVRFGITVAVNAALHPFDYSKTLMQLGYEPIPPVPGKSIFGKSVMLLPNIFQYTAHIRKVDGLYGCYRGIAPKICGLVLSKVCTRNLANQWRIAKDDDAHKSDNVEGKRDAFQRLRDKLKREIVLCTAGVIVFQPFHVVSVRMMAAFVGKETLYSSLLEAVREIYKTEGLLGFFSGLIPRLISDVGCLVLTTSTVFLLNKYVVKDRISRQYNAGLVQFAYSNILYPFQVVSTCMCVTGARLSAGRPPNMTIYKNWMDCMTDLNNRGELKRGSSLILRATNKMLFYRNDRLMDRPSILAKH